MRDRERDRVYSRGREMGSVCETERERWTVCARQTEREMDSVCEAERERGTVSTQLFEVRVGRLDLPGGGVFL